jgi:DNA-binding beta-propeller fold protein YncE
MMKARFGLWSPLIAMLGASILAGGCGSGSATTTKASVPIAGAASACRVRSVLKPVGESKQGSTVALGRLGSKTVAFVADEDGHAVAAIDIDTKKEIGRTKVGGAPSQLLIDDRGRLLVLVRDRGQLISLEAEDVTGSLVTRCTASAPNDAVAIGTNGSQILVSGGFTRTLAMLDGETLATKHYLDVPREPRSIVFSGDGQTAFVSHAVGSTMSIVDMKAATAKSVPMNGLAEPGAQQRLDGMIAFLESTKQQDEPSNVQSLAKLKLDARGKDSCQGFALARMEKGRVFAPQVFVDPGNPDGNPVGYGDASQGGSTEVAAIAVFDEVTRTALPASLDVQQAAANRMSSFSRGEEPVGCMLPRAAAVDAKTGSLLVTCLGIDALIAYDAESAIPTRAERKRWSVGAGPTGVAVDPAGHRAVVFAQFDRTLNVIALDVEPKMGEPSRPPLNPRIALAPLEAADVVAPAVALGRVLFHASGDLRISKDGRACASCHPDGRDDAITWATPQGPRRSVMLAGRLAKSAPYSWSGVENDLHQHLHTTFERLDGSGLRNVELDAIVAYISALPAPAALQEDPRKVERGRAIFHSKEAACASCHADGLLTDNAMHDVKSKKQSDEKGEFNTPSLHLIGGSGPYFHDGRYATLRELLVGVDGTMGHTKQLSHDGQLEDLEAYVMSL